MIFPPTDRLMPLKVFRILNWVFSGDNPEIASRFMMSLHRNNSGFGVHKRPLETGIVTTSSHRMTNSHRMTKLDGSTLYFVHFHLLNSIYFRRDIHSYLFTMFKTVSVIGLLLPFVQTCRLKFGR